MWKTIWIATVVGLALAGCASSGDSGNQPFRAKRIEVPRIAPDSLGNMRIAFVDQNRKSAFVLVNQSNQTHLSVEKRLASVPRRELPLSSLRYKAAELNNEDNVAVVIVEDELMAELAGMLQAYEFYRRASACTEKELRQPRWPPRDAIVVDNNGKLSVLLKEEKMVDEQRRRTQAAEVYLIFKNNLLLAQQCGHHPPIIRQRVLDKAE